MLLPLAARHSAPAAARRRGTPWLTFFTLFASGCLALAACGARTSTPPRPRLVILYATCSLNRGMLAPYSPELRTTPNLARFAREAVVFERHTTESGQSGTDFAALFSGTQADVHGIYHHPFELPDRLQLVFETFGAAGYTPHFFNGHPMASFELGYGQGVAPENLHKGRGAKKRALLQEEDPAFRALLDGLVAHPEEHALVVANFTITHSPYHKQLQEGELAAFLHAFPEHARGVTLAEVERWLPLYEREMLALEWDFPATVARLGLKQDEIERLCAVLEVVYRATVSNLDRVFGGMLAALEARGLTDETLLAFTADHGEMLFRENTLFKWTHGLELTPEVLDVPLLIRAPGLAPGRYEGVSRSIDVYPTLAGLCAVEIPAHSRPTGVDLAPALRGERPAPELLAFSHSTTLSAEHLQSFVDLELINTYFPRTDPELIWVRVRQGDLVVQQVNLDGTRFGLQAFDLLSDRGQTRDIYDPDDALQAGLARALRSYKANLVEGFARRGDSSLTSEQRLDVLRQLGYVGDD